MTLAVEGMSQKNGFRKGLVQVDLYLFDPFLDRKTILYIVLTHICFKGFITVDVFSNQYLITL